MQIYYAPDVFETFWDEIKTRINDGVIMATYLVKELIITNIFKDKDL